jgi:hypothetical protein
MAPIETLSLILDSLGEGRFESAWELMQAKGILRDDLDLNPLLDDLEKKIARESAGGNIRAVNRLKRRMRSLRVFREHGPVARKMIAPVDLPRGYQGKILLVRIVGGSAHGLVCLRAGDEWHREILQNTREEIQDLGFERSDVVPDGGAWVRFEADGTIVVHGSSREFGTCDKQMAADLISGAYPGINILIQ